MDAIDFADDGIPRGDEPGALPEPSITAESYRRQAAWLQGFAEADLDFAEFCRRAGMHPERRQAIRSAWHYACRAERMRGYAREWL